MVAGVINTIPVVFLAFWPACSCRVGGTIRKGLSECSNYVKQVVLLCVIL